MRNEDWQTSDYVEGLIASRRIVDVILGCHGEGIVEHKQGRLETELVPPPVDLAFALIPQLIYTLLYIHLRGMAGLLLQRFRSRPLRLTC
jgi:hypothetical protein